MTLVSKLVLLLYIFYQLFIFSSGSNIDIIVDELSVGKPKNYTLTSKTLYIIEIENLPNVTEKMPPRIFVKCEQCNENNPLLVVVSQDKGVLSWELPVVIQFYNYRSEYKNTERTLCPCDILNCTGWFSSQYSNSLSNNIHPVTVSLSTSGAKNVLVELAVNLEQNFLISLNTNKSVQITPSTPVYYLFDFKLENVSSVLLHVVSEDDTCLIVSIQNVSCPVFDLEENVGYRGFFQTVTRQGGIIVTEKSFPKGFYVVLIVSSHDKFCSNELLHDAFGKREKTVVMSVTKTIYLEDYMVAIGATVFLILLFGLMMFIIFLCSMKRAKIETSFLETELASKECMASTSLQDANLLDTDTPQTLDHSVTSVSEARKLTLNVKADSSESETETDYDLLHDAEFDKNVIRMKNFLYLCDLAQKSETILKKKSDLYFWILLSVGVFYFLPVFQLVFNDQYLVNQFGKEDLCYYNFLCSHPLWHFSDFNHMFSNIGYISFGSLFIILTFLKERDFKAKTEKNKNLCRIYGVSQSFGIFYSMGTALILEGILSLCYHICPNHYNFQFDTSFMYVICTLCMIKIYQARHPDISANAHATFTLLASVIFLGMYGVFSNSLTFRILFTILHLSTCLYLSLKIYYLGRLKLGIKIFLNWLKEVRICCNHLKPQFPSRFLLLMIANVHNWGLAVWSFMHDIHNFSSYLLTILMVNLILYISFYIIMKYCCKEKLQLQTIIYIFLAVLCWTAALYFFFHKTISWNLTPAESKLFNQKCKLFDFYDNHDIWHLISAAAMFFSFMVLLTLDDDLIYVKRSKIVVF